MGRGRNWTGVALALACAPGLALAAGGGMTLEQVADVRAVGAVLPSPDGRQVAYTLSVPRRIGIDDDGPAFAELHVGDANGTTRGYVTGKVNVSGVAWQPDGQGIAFLAKRGDDKARALYRIPLAGGEAKVATTLESDITAFSLSPDGRRAALLAAEPEPQALKDAKKQGFSQKVYEEDWRPVQLWTADLGDAAAKPTPVKVDGSVQAVSWSPAGDRLALVVSARQLTDDTLIGTRVRIVGLDGRVIANVDNPSGARGLAWSTDGSRLSFVSAADKHDAGPGRLVVVDRDGKGYRDVLPGLEGHVVDAKWASPERLVFVSHEGVQARVGEITVGTAAGGDGAQRTLLPAQGPVWTSVGIATGGAIALNGSTPAHAPEAFLLSPGGTEPKRLTDSNPWLADLRLAKQEVVRYAARDGLGIEGLLVHPLDRRGSARVPLVVVVHGGPESHYSNGWLTSYAQPLHTLAAKGYAVFLPNYRSSTGRGVEFSKKGFGRPGMEEFDDVVDGVDHLVGTGLVDTKKVGITGGSYGGYASAWAPRTTASATPRR